MQRQLFASYLLVGLLGVLAFGLVLFVPEMECRARPGRAFVGSAGGRVARRAT